MTLLQEGNHVLLSQGFAVVHLTIVAELHL